jgi:hypothetical protein
MQQQNKDIVYNNVYRFDILKNRKQMRKTWVHISDTLPGFAQNEIQVAPGDRIEIAFCIFNLNGFVDMESLAWHKPSFAKLNDNMIDYTEYNRDIQLQRFKLPRQARGHKILCDIDRICDVEDLVYEWQPYNVFTHECMTPI